MGWVNVEVEDGAAAAGFGGKMQGWSRAPVSPNLRFLPGSEAELSLSEMPPIQMEARKRHFLWNCSLNKITTLRFSHPQIYGGHIFQIPLIPMFREMFCFSLQPAEGFSEYHSKSSFSCFIHAMKASCWDQDIGSNLIVSLLVHWAGLCIQVERAVVSTWWLLALLSGRLGATHMCLACTLPDNVFSLLLA